MTNVELIDSLKKHFPLDILNRCDAFEISDVRLLDSTEKHLKDDVVYFGHIEQLKNHKVNLSQLILCDVSNNINVAYSNLSKIEERFLFSAFNMAKDLLIENLEIESNFSEIISMVINHKSLNDIVNTAAEKLDNSVLVFDLSYKILAYSDKIEINNINWSQVVKRGYCSYEFISAIQKLEDVKNSPDDSTSFIVMCVFDEMRKLCSKIINKGKLIGHVLMFENNSKITKKHHKLLPLISSAISEFLMRDQNFSKLQGSLYENIIYDIVSGADKAYIEKRIASLKLNFPDRMCVLVVNSSIVLGAKHIKGFLIDELKRIIPKSYSIYHDECIIMVAPIVNDHIDEDKLNSLWKFAKKESMQIGVSYGFSNISVLNIYYMQAYSALNLSQNIASDKIIYTYEKSWFYHLISNINKEKSSLAYFCHPSLNKLYNYDLKNNTNLFETLWMYLKNDCIVKDTAEALFIHRNSVSYRMERIYEICNIKEMSIELKHALISSYMIYNYLDKVHILS